MKHQHVLPGETHSCAINPIQIKAIMTLNQFSTEALQMLDTGGKETQLA